MALPTDTEEEFVIAPREICETCHNTSGPKFSLPHLRGPSDIHRANIIPTGSKRESVETSIASAYSEATQLDKEIAHLQMTLKTLTERRDALYKFAKQEQGLFSPIRKLPVDVLRQIFLNIHSRSHYIFCDDLEQFPRIVTQVSSYWRSVAHSCAHMWSNIVASRYQEKYGPTYGELIWKCVTFSNELSLTVELLKGCTPSVLGRDCVSSLGQCAYRWRYMTISDAELSKDIFAHIPPDMSFYALTDLEFQLSTSIVINPSPKLIKLSVTGVHDPMNNVKICSAESLIDVALVSISHPLSTFVGMPWIQITQYMASDISYRPGEFGDVLGQMKNLVSLSLKDATDPESTVPVSLHHLDSLRLADDMETNVLESLTAPSLKTLSLTCEFDPDFVMGFAERSQFSLDLFRIHDMEIDDSWASPEFETVKMLFWENPRAVESGIEWLTNHDVPSPAEIFPRLEWLDISNIPTYRAEDDEWTALDIIHMLESRIPMPDEDMANDPAITGRYLKHAFISFIGFLSQEDIVSFREFFHSDVVKRSRVTMSVSDGVTQIETL